jgi:hypothetical protein
MRNNSIKAFISTRAVPDICRKCFSQIWEATVNGFKIKVEPMPLNLLEEVETPGARGFDFSSDQSRL